MHVCIWLSNNSFVWIFMCLLVCKLIIKCGDTFSSIIQGGLVQSHSRRRWIPKRTLFFWSARPRADAQCVKYTCTVSALSAQFLYWTWASARGSATMSDSHIAHLFYQMNQAHLDVWTTWNCTKLKTAAISSHVSSWVRYVDMLIWRTRQ